MFQITKLVCLAVVFLFGFTTHFDSALLMKPFDPPTAEAKKKNKKNKKNKDRDKGKDSDKGKDKDKGKDRDKGKDKDKGRDKDKDKD